MKNNLFLMCFMMFFIASGCNSYKPIKVTTSKIVYSPADKVEITVENKTSENIVCFLSLEKQTSGKEWEMVKKRASKESDTTFHVASCEYSYDIPKPCLWRTIFLSLIDAETMSSYYKNSITIQDNLYVKSPLKPAYAIEEFSPGEKRSFTYKIFNNEKLNLDTLGVYGVFVWQYKEKRFGYHASQFEIRQ